MINYSISLRANPSDQDAPKKAYANAQYSEIMTLDKFAEHISTHGSKYNRADIQAVLIQAVDCMREQLLAGQRIQMGDLGTFSIHINSMGAESLETYNPAIHVEDLNVRWKAGNMDTEEFASAFFGNDFEQSGKRTHSLRLAEFPELETRRTGRYPLLSGLLFRQSHIADFPSV